MKSETELFFCWLNGCRSQLQCKVHQVSKQKKLDDSEMSLGIFSTLRTWVVLICSKWTLILKPGIISVCSWISSMTAAAVRKRELWTFLYYGFLNYCAQTSKCLFITFCILWDSVIWELPWTSWVKVYARTESQNTVSWCNPVKRTYSFYHADICELPWTPQMKVYARTNQIALPWRNSVKGKYSFCLSLSHNVIIVFFPSFKSKNKDIC